MRGAFDAMRSSMESNTPLSLGQYSQVQGREVRSAQHLAQADMQRMQTCSAGRAYGRTGRAEHLDLSMQISLDAG